MGVFEEIDCRSQADLRGGGIVWIGALQFRDAASPFASSKQSSADRRSAEGFEAFRSVGHVSLKPDRGTQEFRWLPFADFETCPAPAGD